jgi:peptidoglycan/xylan/chitin deacetylase (PgdA/CDA1 family)
MRPDLGPPPDPPRRSGSSRERVARLRAVRRHERRSRRWQGLGPLALVAVAVAALLALFPTLLQLYAQPSPAAARQALSAGMPAAGSTPSPAPSPTPARSVYGGPTAAPGSVTRVPILMYHYIRSVDQGADPAGYGLSVTPENFAAQLDWLASEGYTTLRMDEALACLRGAGGCPPKPVALTFDDGYMDAYVAVLPLLRQRGMVGTFYIVGGFVGQPGYMGTDELRALHAAGMELGAHSMRHLDLTTLGRDEALREIVGSKDVVEAVIGAPITSFCYPAGRFGTEVRALVEQAGFIGAVTTAATGDFGDALLLPRLRVDGSVTLEGFGWLVRSVGP